MREFVRELGKPAIVLFLVSVIVVVLLAFTDHLTAPVIAERTRLDLNAAKKAVLPAAESFVTLTIPEGLATQTEGLATVKEAWVAKDASGTVVGTVVSMASKGYGGPVGFTAGIDASGRITGVRSGAHKETPGLGDKVIAPSSPVMRQFINRIPTAPLKAVKGNPGENEIDVITGSTITSRAAIRAVSGAWELSQKLDAEGGWK